MENAAARAARQMVRESNVALRNSLAMVARSRQLADAAREAVVRARDVTARAEARGRRLAPPPR